MKKLGMLLALVMLMVSASISYSEVHFKDLAFKDALKEASKDHKVIMVDLYTDWCGWCKVMDRETFTDEKVAEYLTKNFYCVKLDAEMKEAIDFNGHKFEYVANQGRNGVHTLAYSLLDGNMGYPSIVYLTTTYERIVISPGYKKPDQLMAELKYASDEVYKTKKWDEYMAEFQKTTGGK